MLIQCKDAIDNPAARMMQFAWITWRKMLTFADIRAALTIEGACSSSDVITSRGRKSETTMEDNLIVVVCGYPELYDTTSYFYKNRNTFCNETGATWQKPFPWREYPSAV